MRKYFKSTVAMLLAATLLTGNTEFAQLQQAYAVTKSSNEEVSFSVKEAVKRQNKGHTKPKSKKKSANRKAHIAYEKKIQKIKKKISLEFSVFDKFYLAYQDINKDGMDECVVFGLFHETKGNKQTAFCNSDIAIYTYYKGKVKTLLECFPSGGNSFCGYINKKQKCFGEYLHTSSDEFTYVKKRIKKGKAKIVAVYKSRPLYNKNGKPKIDKNGMQKCKYTISGKRVSKQKFEKKLYNMELNAKGNEITVYKATKKNMKKMR